VRAAPITRRAPIPGPIAFARGLEVTVTLDEAAFEGVGIFLLGAVLEQFFAKYASINSFTETVVKSTERGEIIRWPARIGRGTPCRSVGSAAANAVCLSFFPGVAAAGMSLP
jgi:type VI secretion system protein ImpG